MRTYKASSELNVAIADPLTTVLSTPAVLTPMEKELHFIWKGRLALKLTTLHFLPALVKRD